MHHLLFHSQSNDPNIFYGPSTSMSLEDLKCEMAEDDVMPQPYEMVQPGLSTPEVKIVADRISSKLIKLMETQLQAL